MLQATICCILNGVRLSQQLQRVPSSASVYRKLSCGTFSRTFLFQHSFLAPSSCFAKVFLLSQILICKVLFFSHHSLSSFNFCIALVQHNIFFTFICMNDFRQQTNLYKSSPLVWFFFICVHFYHFSFSQSTVQLVQLKDTGSSYILPLMVQLQESSSLLSFRDIFC